MSPETRQQFKKVLRRRVENPHVPAARLRAKGKVYKIKLRGVGYRLVYEVRDETLVLLVIGVGRRDEGYEILLRIGRDSLDGLD
ncbi:MAG: type II toxin-antitoxin system RelE/ParE family toxin [Devosia sp.]